MNLKSAIEQIHNDNFEQDLKKLYGKEVYSSQKERYLSLLEKFSNRFTETEIRIISSPGRTELGGNHTDHNYGRVLAASIQLDSLAIISASNENNVTIYSEGFPKYFTVSLDQLDVKKESEDSTTSLIRGILSIFKSKGKNIGGFNAYIASDVLIGSGLSSSASIEVLLGKILSVLFNDDAVDSVELAKIGQSAENIFLEKPCGLMDQVACSYGGIVAIDFKDPSTPVIEQIDYSFEDNGYRLLVIDTGGDHADLTDDYAAIPAEMKSVAAVFGEQVCRFVNKADFMKKIPEISEMLGDRAVLRALHFFNEDDRVIQMVDKLRQNDLMSYLRTVQDSGDSSYKFLQNVFTSKHIADQKISLAIALTESYKDFSGAVRVHGGGFAGTVQVYIKNESYEEFKNYIEQFFGNQSVTQLKIRSKGAIVVL
jgi:galactokinase